MNPPNKLPTSPGTPVDLSAADRSKGVRLTYGECDAFRRDNAVEQAIVSADEEKGAVHE